VAHTDPTNRASVFQITALTFTPYFQVQFLSAADRLYTLNGSTNLVAGGCRTVPGQVRVAGTGGLCTLSDTNAAGLGRYYRLLVDLPDVQNFAELSATAALGMIVDRHNDADFVVLDVRTATEYNTLHILGAINRDYYATNFPAQLNALDKNKAYLIHCRTGGRSGVTYELMRSLGFHEVYNLLGGFDAFQAESGASAWLVVGP
jgi:rhodanese-related sulfurtransferase